MFSRLLLEDKDAFKCTSQKASSHPLLNFDAFLKLTRACMQFINNPNLFTSASAFIFDEFTILANKERFARVHAASGWTQASRVTSSDPMDQSHTLDLIRNPPFC